MRPHRKIETFVRNAGMSTNAQKNDAVLKGLIKQFHDAQERHSAGSPRDKRKMTVRSRVARLAAAAVIILGVSMGISYIAEDQPGSIALGDVFEAMKQVTELTWTEVSEVAIPDDPNVYVSNLGHVAQCYFKAPAQRRREVTAKLIKNPKTQEVVEHTHIHIFDRNAGKALLLDPEKLTAELHDFKPTSGIDPTLGAFLAPKANIPQDAEDLGARQVDGRDAVGFRLHKKGDGTDFWSGDVTDIWVDVKTKRVIRLKTGASDDSYAWILKDFVFDRELDDSLFSLEPPPGYSEVPPQPIYNVQQ
ncbi:MAG: hypothetical protein ACYS8Z_25770 [Planctomycetota bacterium]|jgi:outer membrane lipoprotein-sorting protein